MTIHEASAQTLRGILIKAEEAVHISFPSSHSHSSLPPLALLAQFLLLFFRRASAARRYPRGFSADSLRSIRRSFRRRSMPKRKACAGCQHLRARCVENSLLAPYFPASDKDRFHRVTRIFGVRSAKRILQALPAEERKRAADCMAEEAYWRLKEPTKGYTVLVQSLKEELGIIRKEITEIRERFGLDVTEEWNDWKYLSDDTSEIEKQG